MPELLAEEAELRLACSAADPGKKAESTEPAIRVPEEERSFPDLIDEAELRLARSAADPGKEAESTEHAIRPHGEERSFPDLIDEAELRLARSVADPSERDGWDESLALAGLREEAEHVPRVMARLEEDGHAPQRHEGQVSERQIIERVMFGHDPAQAGSDKTIDAETGDKHRPPRSATRFNTPEAMVRTYLAVCASEEFEIRRRLAEADQRRRFQVELPLERVLGPEYGNVVYGVQRDSSSALGWREYHFTNQSAVRAVFVRTDLTNPWRLLTMYPQG